MNGSSCPRRVHNRPRFIFESKSQPAFVKRKAQPKRFVVDHRLHRKLPSMKTFLFILTLSISWTQNGRLHAKEHPDVSTMANHAEPDSIPKRKVRQQHSIPFPDALDERNLMKAEISRSDSLLWVNGNIRKDYRIFGYERPSTRSRPLILFSVFTRDVEKNPYQCRYGAFYSTSDFALEDTRIRFDGLRGTFVKAHLEIKGIAADTIFFERRWIRFVR